MSDVVERLAERWRAKIYEPNPHGWSYDWEARWWLNAVADELEARALELSKFNHRKSACESREILTSTAWLRSQVEENDDG